MELFTSKCNNCFQIVHRNFIYEDGFPPGVLSLSVPNSTEISKVDSIYLNAKQNKHQRHCLKPKFFGKKSSLFDIEFRNSNSLVKKSQIWISNSAIKAFLHARNRIRERNTFKGLKIFIENGSLSNNRMSNSRASFMRVS